MRAPERSVAALAAVCVLLGAGASGAGPATLKRAIGNVVCAPVDVALSPLVAADSLATGLRDEEDPIGVRIAFVAPGLVWNTGVQALANVVREAAGLLELLPGIAVWIAGTELSPLYGPAEHGDAWVDLDARALDVRFGIDYTRLPSSPD